MTDSQSADRPLAVVVLAAGQGTRMRSDLPKVLHRIAGVPMLEHVIAAARTLPSTTLVVVVRHERELVASLVRDVAEDALLVDQDEIPGTGRAVELAVQALPAGFAGDVLVLNGDLPLIDAATLDTLVAEHRASGAAETLLTAVLPDPAGYGRVLRAADGGVARIVEDRDASGEERLVAEINAGVYLLRSEGLAARLAALATVNAQGERYLTDLVADLVRAGERVAAIVAPDAEQVAGVNDRVQLASAGARLNARIVRDWQLAGVTVVDPATTWIDSRVQLEADVELRPNTHLEGATAVAGHAVIGPDTTLVDTEVGRGAHVRRSEATLAVIGAGADVGPFSYLRPGTILGADGKIGAYVETKNAQIGDRTKVPHLSYVGDATVGTDTNLGCGTITANYDGVAKHRTQIGSHVRSASHTVYVAPVRIGDGAYTGAGTVVRKDVPPGSLALSVAPQRNIQGWVAEHRPGTAAAEAAAADTGEPGQ